MDGAAQATRARQLPPGTARAHPQARRHALVAATSSCSYRTAVAGVLIHGRRGTNLERLYKGTPSSSKPSGDPKPSP